MAEVYNIHEITERLFTRGSGRHNIEITVVSIPGSPGLNEVSEMVSENPQATKLATRQNTAAGGGFRTERNGSQGWAGHRQQRLVVSLSCARSRYWINFSQVQKPLGLRGLRALR